jgi:RluA family pseudouridine synthase
MHRTLVVAAPPAGIPLIDFLALRLDLSRRKAKAILDERRAFVNGHRVWMAHHRLKTGDRVEFAPAPDAGPAAPAAAPRALYRDDRYQVFDKPPSLLTVGRDSLESVVKAMPGQADWRAAHRLDRDTSGCVLFAADRDAFERAVTLFRDRRVHKVYHALVRGAPRFTERTVSLPLDGQPAVSHVRVVDAGRAAAHVTVVIETGRTHQIRKHLSAIGHPVLGDRAYGTGGALAPELRAVPRQMVHAAELAFPHPDTGQPVTARSPLPADFKACMRDLGLR